MKTSLWHEWKILRPILHYEYWETPCHYSVQQTKSSKDIDALTKDWMCWVFVVTSTQNHRIIHLFNIIEILNKFKIIEKHWIWNFSSNIDMRTAWHICLQSRSIHLFFLHLKRSCFLKSMLLPNFAFNVF